MGDQLAAVAPLNFLASLKTPVPSAKVLGARQGFDVLLEALRQQRPAPAQKANAAPAPYTVKRGDTLSSICAAAIRSRGEEVTQAEILAATRKVAAENRIMDADRIYEGQRLHISSLRTSSEVVPQGGRSMPALDWGVAMVADALKVNASDQRVQPIVKEATRISSDFGPRKNPFSGKREFHSGIDIAAAAGSPLYPVRPGTVCFSGWQSGYGKVVIVQHEDNSQTLYAHNQRNLVKAGQRVDWDTPIGQVGSTGDSTGPHVHFELRRNGRPVRPDHAVVMPSLHVAKAL